MAETTKTPKAAKPKTRTVVMFAEISGTRDGKDWPRQGEELVCSAEEAADLIANKHAVTPAQWKAALKRK